MSTIESFGQWVRTRRRELGLTQDELAHRVGCAQITLRKIEHDDLRPSVQIAERLAMALNIPLEERAVFVRLARAERAPEPITPPPAPRLEEFGVEDLSGRAVRGYALAERIGAGGMGAVYRAVQPTIEREVAIKIILPQYANQPDFIRRFEAEAQLVARLEHPHIVPLYDYWREPNVAFLVMRLLRGGSLRGLLEKGALPTDMVVRLLEQVGSALGAAHRAGVVHRDLKPANVMLDEDSNAYLADFGIAKNLSNPNFEDQTQADVIIGSPAYLSPEQIRSEFVRPQTDIYALGVMLYELLTGTIPFSGPTPIEVMRQHLSAPLPPLAANRVGLPKAWDDVISHATAKDPLERYADVESMLADVHRVTQRLEIGGSAPISHLPSPITLTAADNPYKGLRAFGEGDAADFFGREALTGQLLARLSEGGDLARFLAVVGPSGSGKSSIVAAGLVPALRRGGLPGSENWFIVQMLPGSHPLEELEAALLRIAVNPPDSLLTQLREDKRGLLRAVRRCLPEDPNVELVLVIDQFEEVFTLVQDEAVRAHLLDSLTTAVLDERSRMRVIITLRADFIDRPLGYVDFGELMRQRMEVVLPLTPDESEQAIVGPADRVGLQFEAGLVQTIVRDVGDQPGALPLLQYALTELFEEREGNLLTKSAYQAIGGVLGALGRRAEEVHAGLNETDQAAARQLFLRLVTLGEDTEDTRRRVLRLELEALANNARRDDFSRQSLGATEVATTNATTNPINNRHPAINNVLDVFGKHRLLTFDRDPITRRPTVEVAHEALLREWPRLREWLNDSRADVRLQRTLAEDATQWNAAQRDASYLLIGAHLEQFEGWAAMTTVALTQDERAYLDASIAERDRQQATEADRQRRELEAARQLAETERARADSEQRRAEEQTRSANRLRGRNRVIAAAGSVALLLAILAGIFGAQSNQSAKQATSRELASAALANLEVDPQLSILLALKSIDLSQSSRTTPVVEAQDALHQAIQLSRLKFSLSGHSADVTSLAFSPDGRWLATSSADGTTRLWDMQTREEIAMLARHEGAVNDLAFSPDGKMLATVGDDTTLRLWDLGTFQARVIPTGHTLWVVSVAFNADGTRLVTASRDDSVQVRDVATGDVTLQFFCGDDNDVTDAAFSPSGLWIVTTHENGAIATWGAISGSLRTWEGGRYSLQNSLTSDWGKTLSTAFSPNSQLLLTAHSTNMAKLWNPEAGKELHALYDHTGSVLEVAFNARGNRFVTTSQDGTARIYDTSTGQQQLVLFGNKSGVVAAAFSPDDRYLATANGAEVKVWDATPASSQEWPGLYGRHGEAVTGVAYLPDGKRILTTGVDGQIIVSVDPNSKQRRLPRRWQNWIY